MCISATLKNESEAEPLRGMRAVYDTIKTRMKKSGKSACEVVLEPRQFSGMTKKKIAQVDEKSLQMFWKVSTMKSVCSECEYFHRKDLPKQKWTKGLVRVTTISNHVFYKERV